MGKRKRSASNVSEQSVSSAPKKRARANSNASEKKAPKLPDDEVKQVLFQRIDPSKWEGKIQNNLVDCTFEAKAKFGQGGDSYGSWSSSRLIKVQGKNFTKEKNKMKNRNTHASGRFDQNAVNSVKFD